MDTTGLGINGIDITTEANARALLDNLTGGINFTLGLVNTQRSTLGAIQNRLEFTINSLQIQEENAVASERTFAIRSRGGNFSAWCLRTARVTWAV